MEVSFRIPDDIAAQLDSAGDLSRMALEALAIEGYRREVLSVGEVAELLGLSVYEADGFLKSHGIDSDVTIEEMQRQRVAIDALISR